MNQHRSILAGLFALVIGVALWGGGCASGGETSAQSGDDGGGMDGTTVTEGGGDASEAGACAAGKTRCGSTCTATSTDPKNCGKCGTVCASGQVCSQGACAAGCSGGETLCGGPADSGAGSGGGDSGGDDGGGSSGADSGTPSGGGDGGAPYCSNLSTDPMNCGGCGVVCGGTCAGGTCTVGTCPAGQVGCPASGTCIPMGTCCNSGECTITGQVCPMPGGQCACPTGEHQCGAPLNSCVSAAACCSNADCTVTGQSCTTPGQPCTCMASLQCCVTSDCAAEQNVASATCTANKCIATCTAGCYDLNSSYTDGCECCDTTGAAHTCAGAGNPTALTIGGTPVTFTGTIPEPTGGDWYAVSFADPGTNTAFHPKVTFSANPSVEFLFEIIQGACGNPDMGCPEGGNVTGKTDWEISYVGPSPAADPASYPVTGSHFMPIPAVGTVFIHVYRASTSAPATCDQYALVVSE